MAQALELEVATPERAVVNEQVTEVQVPGLDGYLGILPGHAPLLSLLGSGSLSYNASGTRRFLAVQGGVIEVVEDHVRVLANIAERAEEIDAAKARADVEKAEHELQESAKADSPEVALEAAALARARVAAVEGK